MIEQITDTLLMIRPIHFRMNEQTMVNNYYQKMIDFPSEQALQEFTKLRDLLENSGINVLEYRPDDVLDTPDEVFPNNWISFHYPNIYITYPMFAENRRLERRGGVIDFLAVNGITGLSHLDLSYLENEAQFLEGTGSIVLDRVNRIAYASVSERMHRNALEIWAQELEYQTVVFHSYQGVGSKRLPVYHTNVVMSIGEQWALCCLDAVDNIEEKRALERSLGEKRELITIPESIMDAFGGNILEVKNKNGDRFVIMSKSAADALGSRIIEQLTSFSTPLISDLTCIETWGGGSARCMLAEVFVNSHSS